MKKILITILDALLFNIIFLRSVHAITSVPSNTPSNTSSAQLGNLTGFGPLGLIATLLSPNDVTPATTKLAAVLSAVIGIITICAGFWFLLQILIAGFSYITAGGDKNKIQESQHKITNALIGMIIVIGAYALTALLGKILGIPDILNIGQAIINMGIKP